MAIRRFGRWCFWCGAAASVLGGWMLGQWLDGDDGSAEAVFDLAALAVLFLVISIGCELIVRLR